MNLTNVRISILLIVIVFTLAFTVTRSGETQSPSGDVAAFANAWSIHVDDDPDTWNIYASASAYADSTNHGAENSGSFSISAYAYMEGGSRSENFSNGGGDSMSYGKDYHFPGSSSASANITSVLGSDSASDSS